MQAEARTAYPLEARNLSRRFGDFVAVDDVSLSVPAGQVTAILGTSGSGKTTLLRMIAGFEPIANGRVCIGDVDVSDLPPFRRDIGFVFQQHALFPHMTVAQNVEYPLRMRAVPRKKRSALVERVLELAGLAALRERHPAQLSGGEQQRVALARAVVFGPRILLMDEPLSSLDKRSREQLQHEIRTLQRALRITTVYVTHDQNEAFMLGDRIAVMNAGRIVQEATPRELYERPGSDFVARFVGNSNIFSGRVVIATLENSTVQVGDTRILCNASLKPGEHVSLFVRPEKLAIEASAPATRDVNVLEADVVETLFLGELIEFRLQAGNNTIVVRKQNVADVDTPSPGAKVFVTWPISATVVLC